MKNDSVSRQRFSPQQRARPISQYHRSGLTQRAFSQTHHLSLATLTKWLRHHRQSRNRSSASSASSTSSTAKPIPAFQSLDLPRLFSASSWVAEIALPDGAIIRLAPHADAAFTAHLIQTLRRAC